jgi:hypothetical protein
MLIKITLLEALATAIVFAIGILMGAITILIFWTEKEGKNDGLSSSDESGGKHPR